MTGVSSGTIQFGKSKPLAVILSACTVFCFLAACSKTDVLEPLPESLVDRAVVIGMPAEIRFWGDQAPPNLDQLVEEKTSQMKLRFSESGKPKSLSFLALSGGGEKGAYGAGIMKGWTEHGSRPEFEIVTGISTGSLIAPFAFLGPAWDGPLETAYTSITAAKVFKPKVVAGLLGGDAVADNKPLADMIASFANQNMMRAIAAKHNLGHRLLIGTTNLEAQRPVVWDIGRIANSGHPEALPLFRKILLASAAIPGAFPPTPINVTVAGKQYSELHVDGGVTTQVFLFPTQTDPKNFNKQLGFKPKRKIYVIRNSKINPEHSIIKTKLIKVAARSVNTLIKSQGIGDLQRIYTRARNSGNDYNLAFIPPEFDTSESGSFDQKFMRRLFDFGYQNARTGYPWSKKPPL